MINDINELLEKFDGINFDSYQDKEFTKGEWILRYYQKHSAFLGTQIILNLYHRDKIVQSWGCIDDDNLLVVEWIKKQKVKIERSNSER